MSAVANDGGPSGHDGHGDDCGENEFYSNPMEIGTTKEDQKSKTIKEKQMESNQTVKKRETIGPPRGPQGVPSLSFL